MRFSKLIALGVFAGPLLLGAAHYPSVRQRRVQFSASARDTVGCLDTLHASDSISALVVMSVRPQDAKAKFPTGFEGLFVQEFRSRLKVGPNLPLSVMAGWSPCDSANHKCAGGVLMVGSRAYATVHNDGTLSRITAVDFSLTPSFADTVRAVLQRISEEKMAPPLSQKDSIPLEISIHIEQRADTVPTYRYLFRAKIPHYNTEFSYAKYPRNASGPRYPLNAEMARVGDSVTLTFTILPDGTVASQSVDVTKGHYMDFIRSVVDKVATAHYVPARIGACPVATWETQSFVFRMR